MSAGLTPQRAAEADAAGTGVAADDTETRPVPRRRTDRTGRTLLALTLAALLLTGGTLLVLTDRTANAPGAANQALTDGERTRRVVADVSDALAAVFTYTPDDLTSTERRARDVLRGEAAKDYRLLFGKLRRQVTDQELSLTTQVVRAGAVELTGDTAQLLVFLDQRAKRKGAKATTAAAQLSITARRDNGRWTITDIKAR
jgi:Mce-associated membrane protein